MKLIKVYSKPNCVACDQTKKWLDKNEVQYTVIDITLDSEAFDKIVKMGFSAAPVVETDSDAWAGFRLDKLEGLKFSK